MRSPPCDALRCRIRSQNPGMAFPASMTVPLQTVRWNSEALLGPHFGTLSYQLPALAPAAAKADLTCATDEQFWQSVLGQRLTAGMTVTLDRFHLLDWFPRAPGLYHTEEARWAREEAVMLHRHPVFKGAKSNLQAQERNDYTVILTPQGKSSMLQGGVGCIRLKPLTIAGEPHWLMSASAAGIAHAGVPLAVPRKLYAGLLGALHDEGHVCARIRGELDFVPDLFTALFDRSVRVPRLYVRVTGIEACEPTVVQPESTIAVSFVSEFEGRPDIYATYVTFRPDVAGSFDEAVTWMKREYVEGEYDGRIITDFDQTRTIFPEARLALKKVMGRLVSRGELRETIELMQANASVDEFFSRMDRQELLAAKPGSRRSKIFISYAHAAEAQTGWVKQIRTQLGAARRGDVEVWDDSRIKPGQKWKGEIEKAIRQARVAVLVITAEFLASEFIRDSELPLLLEAADAEGATILCVYGSDTAIVGDAKRLLDYQFLNGRERPLQAMSPAERSLLFRRLAEAVDEKMTPA